MPIVYSIRHGEGLVVSRHIGAVCDQELIDSYRELFNQPDYDPCYNKLVDLRETDCMERSVKSLECMADLVKIGHACSMKRCKAAIVAPHDLSYGLARVFQVLVEDTPEEVRVFRELPKALDWLGIGPGVLEEGWLENMAADYKAVETGPPDNHP